MFVENNMEKPPFIKVSDKQAKKLRIFFLSMWIITLLGIILTLAIGGYSKEEDIKITLLNFNEKEIFINKKN